MLTTLQQAIRERELGLATNHTNHMHMKYNLHRGSIYIISKKPFVQCNICKVHVISFGNLKIKINK